MTRSILRWGASALTIAVVGAMATACTFGAPAPDASGGDAGVPEAALEVMNQPQYANGRWLISVKDLDTGEVLIDLDGDKMAEPASFTKTYSVGAAWLKWGPDYIITTPVKRMGEVAARTLNGDLVLVGKGDFTLGGRTKADGTVDYTDLDHNDANPLPGATLTTEDPLAGLDDLAAQVKASGIDSVTGTVVVDDRLFQGTLDGEPITPIVVNQNLIDVLVTPGAAGEPATVEMTPAVAPWHIVSDVQTVAAGEKFAISNPESTGRGAIAIDGTIAADSEPVLKVYALEDPATFARTAFIEALGRAGVTVGGDPIATNSTASLAAKDAVDALPSVAEFDSLPLAQQATYVMKISYNRGAQAYVCLLSAAAGVDDCSAGLDEVGKLWTAAGLDTTGVSLIDGSGLNGNFITPDNGVAVQSLMAKRPDADQWRATMPILGVDGSLATVQPDSPAAGKVFAKTGTLLDPDLVNDRYRVNTKALGGVMESESGRNLAFTIIMNQGFAAGIEGVFAANDDVGAVAAAIQQHY
ncbi:D-alanyl-D-alanine carboxypeptidase [Microbacterium sp. Root61]|uniref:D-alanyl-D-alanine carboxypeptidase/D-alanyl-D-alanine endopeptidase n=1 Tax=Microbacterium sp. Root61 TaxID=1736570 RepID=UPI0006F2B539|nr:D-alanyl-D-alanine carboxypeptidase/D-alanyl-D-alanine-endopeptidase [Microbacterium sp. Root61]KRA23354.1 D-alanyl-D-alanine carboxypeptidase [Microbacterium sp. Root61]